jgi:hypothetical protein
MCEADIKRLIVEHEYGKSPEPCKLKLIKGQKNSYGWEISISGQDFLSLIKQADDANELLKAKYGNGSEAV